MPRVVHRGEQLHLRAAVLSLRHQDEETGAAEIGADRVLQATAATRTRGTLDLRHQQRHGTPKEAAVVAATGMQGETGPLRAKERAKDVAKVVAVFRAKFRSPRLFAAYCGTLPRSKA
mmetsp:Transcript_5177/g.11528  ORF Transcript_5177/g.11528 Transcript_5177/m.11528 type:complete len:118 (-) Transcript_5177:958-1311(-)